MYFKDNIFLYIQIWNIYFYLFKYVLILSNM